MGHRACPDLPVPVPVPVKISLERLMEARSQRRGREEANTWRNFFFSNTVRGLFFPMTRSSVNRSLQIWGLYVFNFIVDNCISIFDTPFNLQICMNY